MRHNRLLILAICIFAVLPTAQAFLRVPYMLGNRGDKIWDADRNIIPTDPKLKQAAQAIIKLKPPIDPYKQEDDGVAKGSGFFIDPLFIITNSHVTWAAPRTKNQKYKLTYLSPPLPQTEAESIFSEPNSLGVVIAEDLENDLALVKAFKARSHFVSINSSAARTNDAAFALNYTPYNRGIRLHKNTIEKVKLHPPFNLIRAKGIPSPGASGSALFSKNFDVIGVIMGGGADATFSAPALKVQQFITSLRPTLQALGFTAAKQFLKSKVKLKASTKTYIQGPQDVQAWQNYYNEHKKALQLDLNSIEQSTWFKRNLHASADINCKPPHLSQSFKWHQAVAKNGHPFVQVALGHKFNLGEGTPKNDKKAVHWFSQAAKSGEASGHYHLGEYYRKQALVQLALQHLHKSERYSPKAHNQLALGHAYEQKGDLKQAQKWYQKAAASGSEHARYHLTTESTH